MGNNKDSWIVGSRIWFEGATAGKLGSLYVGYGNGFSQGGMNDVELALFSVYIDERFGIQ